MTGALAGWWRRVVDWTPIAPTGWALGVGAIGASYGVGIVRQDRFVLAAALTALGLLAVCAVITLLVAAALARRAPSPIALGDVSCETPFATDFFAPGPWWFPVWSVRTLPRAPLGVRAEMLTNDQGFSERLTASRRGEVHRLVRTVEVRDTFGLCRVRFERHDPASGRFLPWRGQLGAIQLSPGLAGGDQFGNPEGSPQGDLIDLRPYAPGDPIRYVLWRVYARSRELVVRTPERALSPAWRTVAWLVVSPADEASAAAARVAIEGRMLGREWAFGADGVRTVARSEALALSAVVESGGAPLDAGGEGLPDFLQTELRGSGRVVLFCPPRPGPWLARVVGALALVPSGTSVEVVIAFDGLRPPPGPVWRVAAAEDDAMVLVTPNELAAVARPLHDAGAQVALLDRVRGQVVGMHQLGLASSSRAA